MATNPLRDLWQARLPIEAKYWDAWLDSRGCAWAADPKAAYAEFEARFDPTTPLQPELRALIDAPDGAMVAILDVGAGPATAVGTQWPGRKVYIEAIDALGDQYAHLLWRHELRPPVWTFQMNAEEITYHELFDLAYARNSLDHAFDPLYAIEKMLHAVKPGGCVYLLHHDREASRRDGEGLHRWNFYPNGDTYVMERYDMKESFTLYYGSRMSVRHVPPDQTEVIIRKAT